MGISIEQWRLRIGRFCAGHHCKGDIGQPTSNRPNSSIRKIGFAMNYLPAALLCALMMILLLMAGDVESNPGPITTRQTTVMRNTHLPPILF